MLGITDNDLRCMAAETDEEQLFGSDHEGSVHSDSSGYSDMPPLIPAWPTVESLGDEHPAFLYVTSSTDEGPSSTDSEAEAIEVTAGRQHHRSTAGRQPFHAALSSLHRQGMQVTAGSSTDEPGSTYSGPGAVTGPSSYIMQVLDTHHHQAFSKLYLESVYTFDEKPFWPRYALTAGHGWLPISGSHTIVPRYSLRPLACWRSLHLPLPRLCLRSSSFGAVRSRAETGAEGPSTANGVSRALGDARCVAEWTNVVKIRRLAEIYLKNDLSIKMVQVDEIPIHVNASASKAVETLEHEGAPVVALRINQTASRDRLTLMTCGVSGEMLAGDSRCPPIAACIKATSPALAPASAVTAG